MTGPAGEGDELAAYAHDPEARIARPELAAVPSLADVVDRLQRAHRRRAFEDMRQCFHDDARIESVAAGRILGPEETVAAIRDAFDEGIYSMSEWTIEPLDDPDAVLVWGGVRYRVPGQQQRISDSTVFWLTTARDGLMWRVRIFPDRAAATTHFAQYGHSLGL